ncbi:MAG: hypothetical protein RMX68_012930 [Aulosira sp. ZfuVER01]|nr:hypothetical protein [Aulosira sp. DedVER01a]MDZ8056243.1 hypothetical protein [Aulosira sp. ZfuCHP01]
MTNDKGQMTNDKGQMTNDDPRQLALSASPYCLKFDPQLSC